MQLIREDLVNGNITTAINRLYELPLTKYPELFAACAEDPEFGRWVSRKMEMLISNRYSVADDGDEGQREAVSNARKKLEEGRPVLAMGRLHKGAIRKDARITRRSVRFAQEMLFEQGLAGLDALVTACNNGLRHE